VTAGSIYVATVHGPQLSQFFETGIRQINHHIFQPLAETSLYIFLIAGGFLAGIIGLAGVAFHTHQQNLNDKYFEAWLRVRAKIML